MKNCTYICLFICLIIILTGCENLRESKPIIPIKEYEKMIAGRLDANYVGTDKCVEACHDHDKIVKDFKASVHGEQIKPETGLPLVNCESCHGAGSLAIEHAKEMKKCDSTKFIDIKNLPSEAKSLICLKCHTANSTPVLTHWNGSIHAANGVSCPDCHKLHAGPNQKVKKSKMAELCFGCHKDIKMEASLNSHHPIIENKLHCTDCHNPMGTNLPHDLLGDSIKDLCGKCHQEKIGPFVYEHADVTEYCPNCHKPHGSINDNLLVTSEPFLCLQCHAGHRDEHNPTLSTKEYRRAFYTKCTECHSRIHGTDKPSKTGRGTFVE